MPPKKAPSKPNEKVAVKKIPAKATKGTTLENRTVVQLRKLAKEKNISLTGLTKKADIIQALSSPQKATKTTPQKATKTTPQKATTSPSPSMDPKMDPETKKVLDQFVRTVIGAVEQNWSYYGITVAPEDMPRLLFKNPKTFSEYEDVIISDRLLEDSGKDIDEFVRLVSERGEYFNANTITIALLPEGLKKELVVWGDSERVSHIETYRVGKKVGIRGIKGQRNLVIVPAPKNVEGILDLEMLRRRLITEGRLDERKSRPDLFLLKE